MKRSALTNLKSWYSSISRKPLILRGARQVGKSTLVRLFCEEEKIDLIEFNLEIDFFYSIEKQEFRLQELLDEIQFKKHKIINSNSLIFFDEIQESPKLLKLLRYFFEQKPDIKIIAAGSLLEVAIHSDNFSFPVGRVDFFHLGPMTFKEFLWATGQEYLDKKISSFEFSDELHNAALLALRNYYYVGGMPAAVKNYVETGSMLQMRKIQNQIIQTYKADFPKYNKRINSQRIARIFDNIASMIGNKIIFSKFDTESRSRDIRRVIELLIDARVILSCSHTDGNNVPIAGENDSRIFKTYLLDIGLLNSILKLDLEILDREFNNNFNTKGIIAEQFVAQHLNILSADFREPSLYYHLRDKKIQKAEIDFVIEIGQHIYPIEVKSSLSGHLKSLKYFCDAKKSKMGIKLSLNKFNVENNFINNTKLVCIPLYAVDNIVDLIHSVE